MANIDKELNQIKNAVYGREVRGSIHDGIDKINKETEKTTNEQETLSDQFKQLIIDAGNSNAEVVASRGKEDWLPDRLNSVDQQLAETASQTDLDTVNSNIINLQTTKVDKTYVDSEISKKASGAPKGTYADITALETALPSGDSGNYVLQSDGHIYNWNGTSWVDTGILYQAVGIAKDSVSFVNIDNKLKKAQLSLFVINDETFSTSFTIENLSSIKYLKLLGFDSTKRHRLRSISRNNSSFGYRFIISQESSQNVWEDVFDTKHDFMVTENLAGVTTVDHTIGSKRVVLHVDYGSLASDGTSLSEIDMTNCKFVLSPDCFNDATELEKRINDDNIYVINKVKNGNFETDTSNWSGQNATVEWLDGKMVVTASSYAGSGRQLDIELFAGHQYYLSAKVKSDHDRSRIALYGTNPATIFGYKLHSGSGDTEELSVIIDQPTTILDGIVRVLDYRDSEWSPIEVDDVVLVDLTEAFGVGNEPDLITFQNILKQFGGFVDGKLNISSNKYLLTNLIEQEKKGRTSGTVKSMYVTKSGMSYKAKFQYGNENMVIEWNKLGINELIHPKFIYKEPGTLTDDFVTPSLWYTVTTDWISPYNSVSALTGESTGFSGTVGGNHGTSGSGGFPTARNVSSALYVDGDEVLDGEVINCDKAILIVKNYVSAPNKIDPTTGEKEDSFEEVVTYTITKNNIEVSVYLVAMEDLVIGGYTGLQMTTNMYPDGEVYFNDSANKYERLGTKHNSLPLPFDGDRMVFGDTSNVIATYTNREVGLGDLSSKGTAPIFFLSDQGKLYAHLINEPITIMNGDSAYYSGGYTFDVPMVCQGAEKAYFIKVNGEKIYCVDFLTPISNTYFEIVEEAGRQIEVVDKSESITCDNLISGKGLKISAADFGTLKFKIK